VLPVPELEPPPFVLPELEPLPLALPELDPLELVPPEFAPAPVPVSELLEQAAARAMEAMPITPIVAIEN
jgi:hypothetical protein